ncbi:MAG: 23S rRNA (guanosine(2251)-2'-O)-methyltransferase RlmB [Nocardioidaceae bacterium]
MIGRNPVLEVLRSNTPVRRLLMAEGVQPAPVLAAIERLAAERGIPTSVEARRELTRLSGGEGHQGVLAVVEPYAYAPVAPLLASARRIVLLDEVTDPANLGSILRSADAFGWDAVVVPGHRSVGVTPAVRKVAAGAVERIPVGRSGSAADTARRARDAGFEVVGLDPAGSAAYHEHEWSERICLVAGAEGRGLSRLVRERCDVVLQIPMRGSLASLNVAVAVAIVMADIVRRDGPRPSEPRLQWGHAGVAQSGSASDL